MRIVIGSDHAGFELKEFVKERLLAWGHEVEDVGTHSETSVDYPDYARPACRALQSGEAERGILVCGSGVGMSMAANRHRGVRAVLCTDLYLAKYSRLHNDANVLCLPGRLMGKGLCEEVLKVWLETPFEGGRHGRRIGKLEEEGGAP